METVKIASILLLALMVLGAVTPVAHALLPNPEIPYASENEVRGEPGVPVTPVGVPVKTFAGKDPVVASKLDKALLDADYLKQLSRYAALFKSSYEAVSGKSLEYEPLGLVVKLESMEDLPLLEEAVAGFEGEIVAVYPQIDTVVVAFPADVNVVGKAAYKLAESEFVKLVSVDRLASPLMFDTIITTGAYMIWNALGINGSGILVSVLDTGVDPTHPSIPDPAYWSDFVNGLDTPYDDHGHGTHVAGTILGRGGQVFNTTTGVWHSIIVGENSVYNYPGPANITYAINVSLFQGENITVEFEHFYGLNLTKYNLPYGFNASAYVLAKFDNDTWMVLEKFEGNLNQSIISAYNLTVPNGSQILYLSFILVYNIYTFVSVPGWFINYVAVYNSTNATQIIFYDDVATMDPPPELVESKLWLRTSNTFYGIAPGADLAAGKVCAAGYGCPISAILAGMNWSAQIGANIVSMSLGGPAYIYDVTAEMADWLVDQGIVVVIAAGNEGPYYYTVASPGISHKAITVGAATKIYTYGYFSSAGPSPVDFYVKPDISAPGLGIISAVPLWYASDPAELPWGAFFPYESWMGTSMATPHVSGVAALILQAHPDWTPAMVKSAIVSTGDWLSPSGWMPYTFDVYRQGGGMVDPIQAILTPVIPDEANVFVGLVFKGVNETVTFNVTLTSLAPTDLNITVVRTDLFAINASAFPPQYWFYADRVVEPLVGDSWILPAGQNLTINVTLNMTGDDLVLAPYGGHIEFLVNGTETIHVIFGFPLLTYIKIKGVVFDYITGEPVPGAYVAVYDALLTNTIAENFSGADGSYIINVPSNHTVRLVAMYTGYYGHLGYAFWTPSTDVVYDIPMVPYVEQPTVMVWVEPDPTDWPTKAVEALLAAAEEMGVPVFYWDTTVLGSPFFAALSGDFPVVIYLSGGDYSPLGDPADYTTALYYGLYVPGTIVLSGGDIGWFLDGTRLMYYVAHAQYVADLWPGTYEATVFKTPITWTLFGLEKYFEYYDAPLLAEMNETIVVNEKEGFYPDVVEPVNNGMVLANWTFAPYGAAVWYNGSGNEPAKSVYFAFDIELLDDNLLYELAKRLIAYGLDAAAPEPSGLPVEAKLQGGSLVIFPETAYTDDVYVQFYYATLYDENWTYIATIEASGDQQNVIVISQGELGLEPGIYRIKIHAVDLVGNNVSDINMSWNLVPGLKKGIAVVLFNATNVTVPDIAAGVAIDVNATGAATLQFGELSDITLITNVLPSDVKKGDWQLYTDLFVDEAVAGAVESITLKIQLPKSKVFLNEKDFKAYWFDGTEWREFSDIELDTQTGVVTIYIDGTTTPSIADLGGTPLLLALPPAIVGGSLAVDASAGAAPLALLVAGLVLAAAGLAARKKP